MKTQAKATTQTPDRSSQSRREGRSDAGTRRQLVSFVVAGEEFAVDIHLVKEIIRPIEPTDLPHAPAFTDGIINFRGRLLPIIDLQTRLGLGGRAEGEEARIVVVETGRRPVGLLTDAVREVLKVEESAIDPTPGLASQVESGFVQGVAKLEERLLILLDVEQMLSEKEALSLDEAVSSEAAASEAEDTGSTPDPSDPS